MSALRDLQVVVTRPKNQGEALASSLRKHGAKVTDLPLIRIQPLSTEQIIEQLQPLVGHIDKAIFLSQNAVSCSQPSIQALNIQLNHCHCYAIGEKTANTLHKTGIQQIEIPSISTSEGLLALATLQAVTNQTIAIFSGVGGRKHLHQYLQEQGAQVHEIATYQRINESHEPQLLASIFRPSQPTIVVCTSQQIVQSLYENCSNIAAIELLKVPLLVISDRIKKAALALGFKGDIIVSPGPEATQILTTIKNWYENKGPDK